MLQLHIIRYVTVEKSLILFRFINCAENDAQQNLIAFQLHGRIYYRVFRHISPGEELLVWYGKQYAGQLGLSTEDDANMPEVDAGNLQSHKSY